MSDTPVAVASRSFSRNAILRQELLEHYPRSRFNDEGPTVLSGDRLAQFLRGHTKAITGLDVLSDDVFAAVPELRIVSKYGVGLDMIDSCGPAPRRVRALDAGVNRQAVAELTIAFWYDCASAAASCSRA